MMVLFSKERYWHLFYGKKIENIININQDQKLLLVDVNYSQSKTESTKKLFMF